LTGSQNLGPGREIKTVCNKGEEHIRRAEARGLALLTLDQEYRKGSPGVLTGLRGSDMVPDEKLEKPNRGASRRKTKQRSKGESQRCMRVKAQLVSIHRANVLALTKWGKIQKTRPELQENRGR